MDACLEATICSSRVAPHVLGVGAVQSVRDIRLAGLQHGGPGVPVGNAPHDQALDVGGVPPVPGIGFQHHLHPGGVAHESVRPRTDGLLAESLVADLGQVLFGDDEPRRRRRAAVQGHEVGPRLLEENAHGEGIDDVHLPDARLEFLGPRPPVALVAELHVLRGEGVAIVKLQIAAQLELIGQSIGALRPRLGETRAHLLPGQRPDESVVQGVEHPEGRDLGRRRGRIEPRRGDGDVPGHDGFPGLGGPPLRSLRARERPRRATPRCERDGCSSPTPKIECERSQGW